MKRIRPFFPIGPLSLTILVLISISGSLQSPLVEAPGCQSAHLTLYNASTELPASTTSPFPHTFTTAFAVQPLIAIGMNGYSSLDQLYNELWGITYVLYANFTGMTINVRLETNTRTNVLLVAYLAVDGGFEPGLFAIYSVEYTTAQLVNTQSGTGNRQDIMTFQPSPTHYFSPSATVHHMTNILHMRNAATFGYTVAVSLIQQFNTTTNQTYCLSLSIEASSTGDNRLQKLGLSIIVINFNRISYDNFYRGYVGSLDITSANTALTLYAVTVLGSSDGSPNVTLADVWRAHLIIGFSSWGSNPSVGAAFRWAIQDFNSTKILKLTNTNRISIIRYHFLIFGKVDCPQYWSVPNQTCVSACQPNIEAFYANKPVCRTCAAHCLTCSFLYTNCTSCANGYYLLNNSCHLCDVSLKLAECGYIEPPVPPVTPVTPATPTSVSMEHSPYWLAALSIIPLVGLAVYCYCRHKKIHSAVEIEKISGFKQHPSIQF